MSKVLISAIVLLLFGSAAMFADGIAKAEKREAIKVLNRTANVLMTAQKTVKRHKVYTGDLAKAYDHQRFAKELFAAKDFDRCVRQSIRARQLAYMAIRANKGKISEDMDRDEKRFSKDMKAEEMDKDIDVKYRSNASKDDDVVNLKIDADIK
jgi:hypothetical protein